MGEHTLIRAALWIIPAGYLIPFELTVYLPKAKYSEVSSTLIVPCTSWELGFKCLSKYDFYLPTNFKLFNSTVIIRLIGHYIFYFGKQTEKEMQ